MGRMGLRLPPRDVSHRTAAEVLLMRALVGCLLTVCLLPISGCATSVDDASTSTPAASQDDPASASPSKPEPSVGDVYAACSALGGEELTGEACEAFSVCQAACIAAAGLGCAGVTAICGAGSVFTMGGVTIPCIAAIAAACATATGGMFVCTDKWCGDT